MDIGVLYLKDHNIHSIKTKVRLDSYYASQLENSLEPVLRRVKKIILECSDVIFMDVLKGNGGGLILLNLQETA